LAKDMPFLVNVDIGQGSLQYVGNNTKQNEEKDE
jgi:hypothetical protein